MRLGQITRRELRLGSGLLLFAYITVHFIDHALGLVSLALAERALAISVAVWHSLPGTALLCGAAAIHIALALLAVFERRTLRMPAAQALRIALGLGMPLMVIGHVAATRLAADAYGLAPNYTRIVQALWLSDGEGRQLALLAPGWVHGCLGLAFAFSHRARWQAWRPLGLALVVLLPVLAGLGFVAMGRELTALAASPAWHAAPPAASAAHAVALARWRDGLLGGYLGLIALVFVAREVRAQVQRRRKLLVSISYPQRTVAVPRGWSVLEASRSHGIPHLSLCGGNARCSTCRVHVLSGQAGCAPPSANEQRTLTRIQAPADVRLACQLRPSADLVVVPLLQASAGALAGRDAAAPAVECEVALLLIKLVAWQAAGPASQTALSPHDHVYALDRFLAVVGDAVAAAGGAHGRYDHDGASASFGPHSDVATACRQALRAAQVIEQALDALNRRLAQEVGLAAVYTQAVHSGAAVVVPVGYGRERAPAAVGATVQAAQALREHAAARGQRFVLSRDAAAAAGMATAEMAWLNITIAGTDATLQAMLSDRVVATA